MSGNYTLNTKQLTSRPRSKRLRELGASVINNYGGSAINTGNYLPRLEFDDMFEWVTVGTQRYIRAKSTLVADGNLVALYKGDGVLDPTYATVEMLGQYATKTELQEALAGIGPGGIDTTELRQYLTEHHYITSSQLPDLSRYALKTEIPSLADYYNKTAVDAMLTTINNSIASFESALDDKLDAVTFDDMFEWVTVGTQRFIRAKATLVSVGNLVALYEGDDVPSSSVGLDLAALESYLEDNSYVTKDWVLNQGFLTGVTGFLPLTGGTLKNGNSEYPLIIDTNSPTEVGLRFCMSASPKAWFGYHPTWGTNIYNYASNKYLGIKDDGTPHYQGNTLLHAANYDAYAVTLNTPQAINAIKTFSQSIRVEYDLFFKNTARENGIYMYFRHDSDLLQFAHHKNYAWQKSIGSIDINGNMSMTSYIKVGGTSSQVLMADGSVQTHYKGADVTTATSDNGMITPLAMNQWTSKTFVTALGVNGNYLTWIKNGTANNITVPFASKSRVLEEATGLARGSYDSSVETPDSLPAGLRVRFKRSTGANSSYTWNSIIDLTAYAGSSSSGAGYRNQFLFVNSENFNDGTFWVRNGVDSTWNAWRQVLTDANYSSILNNSYVKKSGDTMTGRLTVQTNSEVITAFKSLASGTSVVTTKNADDKGGYFGYNAYSGYGTVMYNYQSKHWLGISDEGKPHFDRKTIWHAGNDGSGSGLDADMLDGLHAISFVDRWVIGGASTKSNKEILQDNYSSLADSQAHTVRLEKGSHSMAFGWFLNNSNLNPYGGWFVAAYGSPKWVGVNDGVWVDETFAFLSSTVAAANKLATARSIWGQNFDGTGNVSGNMTGVGSITFEVASAVNIDIYGNLKFKSDNTANTWSVKTYGGVTALCCKNDGYVGIGTSLPQYPVDIHNRKSVGPSGFNAALRCYHELHTSIEVQGGNYTMGLGCHYNGHWYWWRGTNGTTVANKSYVMAYDGSIWYFMGTIKASGNLVALSDMRVKSHITDLEFRGRLHPKRYWKDGRWQIGFIAQDVDELYSETVFKSNLLSLDYGALTAVLAAQVNNNTDDIVAMKEQIRNLEIKVETLEAENKQFKQLLRA